MHERHWRKKVQFRRKKYNRWINDPTTAASYVTIASFTVQQVQNAATSKDTRGFGTQNSLNTNPL
jgi:hypothetical protein